MLGPDELRDLRAEPLRERRRRAAGRDGDGDRALAVHGGEDEVAEVRARRRRCRASPRLGVGVHALVDARSEVAAITRNVPSRSPLVRALASRRRVGEAVVELGRDDRHAAPHASRPAPSRGRPSRRRRRGSAALQVEARHVVLRRHYPRRSSRARRRTLDERLDRGDAVVEGVVDLDEGLPVGGIASSGRIASTGHSARRRRSRCTPPGRSRACAPSRGCSRRADALARDVLHVDAGFSDDVGHVTLRWSRGARRPCRAGARARSRRSRA